MVARDAENTARDVRATDPARADALLAQAAAIRDSASLKTAQIRAAGIPIVGKIDCMHRRGTNKGGSDVTDMYDPPGSVEIIDWKFVKNLNYAKTPSELASNIQTALYGKYAFTVWPDQDKVRLSLGYVPTSGLPRKVTSRVSLDQIDETWNRVEAIAGYLRDAARANDPDAIHANTKACNSYGRPCPASGVCRAAMTQSLASVVGVTGAENLLKKIRDRNKPATTMTTPTKPSGFGALGARLGAKAPPAAPSAEEVQAEKARLARQAVLTKYPGLDKLVEDILACGMGFPTVVGPEAEPVGTIRGKAPLTYKDVLKLEGEGELKQFEIPSVEELTAVLGDVQAEVAERAKGEATSEIADPSVPPPSIVPPETPESTHTPGAPIPETPLTAASEIAAQADGTKTKRATKRKPKATSTDKQAEALAQKAEPDLTEAVKDAEATAMTISRSEMEKHSITNSVEPAVNLFVNCLSVEGFKTVNLMSIVDQICADLNETTKPDDFRYVPKTHALAYGAWRPAFAALLRECVDPGVSYRLQGPVTDVVQVVIETMRDICQKSGGFVVIGVL